MLREHDLLGDSDLADLAIHAELRRLVGNQPIMLAGGRSHPGRPERIGIAPARVHGEPADADELAHAPRQHLGDLPQSPVHDHGQVVFRGAQCAPELITVERVGMDVLDEVGDLGGLVATGVQDGHAVTALQQAQHDMRSGGSGAADHQRCPFAP